MISKPPLLLDPSLAVQVGLNEALVVQHLHDCLADTPHRRQGPDDTAARPWIAKTMAVWQVRFPFWSERTLRRILHGLQAQGFIAAHAFGQHRGDATKWYTINYHRLESLLAPSSDRPASSSGKSARRKTGKLAHRGQPGNG